MNRGFFSNFWDSYFSSYGGFGEFSLRFTAPLTGRSLSNKAAHHITAKYGGRRLYSTARLFNPFKVAVVDVGPAWQRAAYARGPTLRYMRHDAKCNVAEIGAVNMGEIGAVRKRSR